MHGQAGSDSTAETMRAWAAAVREAKLQEVTATEHYDGFKQHDAMCVVQLAIECNSWTTESVSELRELVTRLHELVQRDDSQSRLCLDEIWTALQSGCHLLTPALVQRLFDLWSNRDADRELRFVLVSCFEELANSTSVSETALASATTNTTCSNFNYGRVSWRPVVLLAETFEYLPEFTCVVIFERDLLETPIETIIELEKFLFHVFFVTGHDDCELRASLFRNIKQLHCNCSSISVHLGIDGISFIYEERATSSLVNQFCS
eukprot:COSAG03_NODE_7797_length_872_cov_1.019405_1_plen_262_part_01